MTHPPFPDYLQTSRTDEELAILCKNDDRLAFQELMQRYARPLLYFVTQYTSQPEDADDILQDTFFKVWKYIKRYNSDKKFKPWIYTVARNTALDYLKKKKAIIFSDMNDDEQDFQFADTLIDTEPLPPVIFENKEIAAELKTILDTLHPDHRSVLMLHYRDDLTFDEIASIMNKPMNTVKSWHRRALFAIRAKLMHHE